MTSHMLTPVQAATRHRQPGRQVAPAADAPSIVVDAPGSVAAAGDSPDAVALVWDLTVHRLHRAFAACLANSPDATHGGRERQPRRCPQPAQDLRVSGWRPPATR